MDGEKAVRCPDAVASECYGFRWMAESTFSCLKRMFGEYICAVKWPNIVKELLLKASIYTLFMKMNLK